MRSVYLAAMAQQSLPDRLSDSIVTLAPSYAVLMAGRAPLGAAIGASGRGRQPLSCVSCHEWQGAHRNGASNERESILL